MRQVLYILRDARPPEPLFPPAPSTGHQTSVVLVQRAVSLSQVPAAQVYALADDVTAQKVTPSFPLISYGDFLCLLFEADCIVAL